MKTLTASDKLSLLRLASSLPGGSPERKALIASLERTAAEYHEDDLKASLKLIGEIDEKMKELSDLLDARYEGLGSIADSFSDAAKLSQWLRSDVSKKLNQYKNALK
jgi:hypothetical protein